jgi:diaminopimelate decarboxylase
MKKTPFITKEQAEEIAQNFPTPFHIYDEKGIRENARLVKKLLHGIRDSRNILL